MRQLATALVLLLVAGCETFPAAPVFAETQQLRAACPAENAIYTLPESNAELRLVRTAHAVNAFSDLAVRVEADSHVFWFSFVQSNGYGRMFLGYIRDPSVPQAAAPLEIAEAPGDNDLALFDSNLRTLPIPQAGDDAPAYLFAPGIGVRFWYDLINRTPVPIGMWRLTACTQ